MCIKDYNIIRSFLSIWHADGDLCKHLGIDSSTDQDDRYSNLVHGDLCKHLGIDSSTDLDDRYSNLVLNAYRYSNLVLNAYINRHIHTEYLK